MLYYVYLDPLILSPMVDCLGSTSLSPQSSRIWTIFPYTVCYVSLQGSTRGQLKLGIYKYTIPFNYNSSAIARAIQLN